MTPLEIKLRSCDPTTYQHSLNGTQEPILLHLQEESRAVFLLQRQREHTDLSQQQHQLAELGVSGGFFAEVREQLLQEGVVLLDQVHYLRLVKEDDGVEGRHHVLFKQGRSGEDHFLDVLDPWM